jgi:hypothetical protein
MVVSVSCLSAGWVVMKSVISMFEFSKVLKTLILLSLRIAAAVAFFFLDKKETKNQDKGYASPLRATAWRAALCRGRRSFNAFIFANFGALFRVCILL